MIAGKKERQVFPAAWRAPDKVLHKWSTLVPPCNTLSENGCFDNPCQMELVPDVFLNMYLCFRWLLMKSVSAPVYFLGYFF
jgi:hypothetical protein